MCDRREMSKVFVVGKGEKFEGSGEERFEAKLAWFAFSCASAALDIIIVVVMDR